jgi:hypothetical protein
MYQRGTAAREALEISGRRRKMFEESRDMELDMKGRGKSFSSGENIFLDSEA